MRKIRKTPPRNCSQIDMWRSRIAKARHISLKKIITNTRMRSIRNKTNFIKSICDSTKPRTLRFWTNWIHSMFFKSHIKVFFCTWPRMCSETYHSTITTPHRFRTRTLASHKCMLSPIIIDYLIYIMIIDDENVVIFVFCEHLLRIPSRISD